jgi:hypothetical protein
MKSLIKYLFVVFIFCSFIHGQDSLPSPDIEELKALHQKNEGLETSIQQLEERLDTLVQELSKISVKDKAEAKRQNAEVQRLFPCCPLADVDREMFGMSSGYTFRTEKTGDGYYAVVLMYGDESFSFSDQDGNHGFITDLGKIPLENVNEKLPQFAALAKYAPPFKLTDIKKEFVADKITFRESASVKVGDTYLLRAVSYDWDGNIDALYALKVARQDADGSIIVFIKKLKDFPLPKMEKKPKYESSDIYEAGILIKLKELLREQELADVQAGFVERVLVVKGSVPKGKSDELVKILKQLNLPPDTKNEVIEK